MYDERLTDETLVVETNQGQHASDPFVLTKTFTIMTARQKAIQIAKAHKMPKAFIYHLQTCGMEAAKLWFNSLKYQF